MNKYIFKKTFPGMKWIRHTKMHGITPLTPETTWNTLIHLSGPFNFLFIFITRTNLSKNLGIGSPPSHILPFFKETQEWISSCNAFNDFFDNIFILCLKKGYQSLKSIQIHITKWKAVEWNPLLAGGGQFTISAPPCIFSTGHSE